MHGYRIKMLLLALFAALQAQASPAFDSQPATIDETCASSAPAQAMPLCDAMRGAVGEARAQCQGQGADARFCALFGGNIYGLVQGCYLYGEEFDAESRRVCKVVDTFVSALASYCRTAGVSSEPCALAQSDRIGRRQIERYQESWLHRAHALQRELSASQPMRDTMYVATHNSFNATDANRPPTPSGSDANQRYVIVDQLEMDVRGIELDLHWMPSAEGGGFRPTVCHGTTWHAGCSYERSLDAELAELRGWLDAHPGEVLVIDLEDNMNQQPDATTGADRYAQAAAILHAQLGDLLLLPGQDYGADRRAPECRDGQPLDASITELRAAGKQLIIYSDCVFEHGGQQLTFGRNGTHLQTGPGSYIGMQAVDDCRFSPAEIANSWVRFYEDGTLVGAGSGAARQASIEEVREMARCNINMPSLDHLLPFDGRLEALLWSWDREQPRTELLADEPSGRGVTISNAAGRFELRPLRSARRTVAMKACLDPAQALVRDDSFNDRRWRVAADCPPPTRFAVPRNGLDNELLKRAKSAAGVDEVEVNLPYSPDQGWNWPGR